MIANLIAGNDGELQTHLLAIAQFMGISPVWCSQTVGGWSFHGRVFEIVGFILEWEVL